MDSQGLSPFHYNGEEDQIALRQPYGANGFSSPSNTYLDRSVVDNMRSFNPEINGDIGTIQSTIGDLHEIRAGNAPNSQVMNETTSGTLSGEAGNFTQDQSKNTPLNRGFERSFTPVASTSKILQRKEYQVDDLNGQHWTQLHQQNFVSSRSPQQLASNIALNTPLPLRPQHLRRFSNLRNEYIPSAEPDSSMAGHQPQPVYTSSPARYTLRPHSGPQSGSMPTQVLQPFQESNLRSSLQQLPGYETINQMAQDQQWTYLDPQEASQHPFSFSSLASLPAQPVFQHTSATPHFRELAMVPPSTPPNFHLPYMGVNHGDLSFSDSSAERIKHEDASTSSPSTPAKRPTRKVRSRVSTRSSEVVDVSTVLYSKSDKEYVEEMVNAMTDMSQAEDNIGMKATWNKILLNKGDKIRPKCVEMLSLLKRAVDEQLGEKKCANVYNDFDHRVKEFCDAVRTQKTVSKHLMEAPYSHTVANDPTYAASRVRNNRRVNGQKRTAITLGRRAMGLAKGKGKGHKLQKLDGSTVDNYEDIHGDAIEDGEEDIGNSGDDDIFGMEEFSNTPAVTPEPSSVRRSMRKSARKNYAVEAVESPVPKKKKRGSRSKSQIENGPMVDSSEPPRSVIPDPGMDKSPMNAMPRPASQAHDTDIPSSSQNYLTAMGSSPNQSLQPPPFYHNSYIFGYHPYGHNGNATSIPPLHLNHNNNMYPNNILSSDPGSQHYTGYSLGTDQLYSGPSSSADTVTHGDGTDHKSFHEFETR